jgi:hypothetical protein
LFVIRSARYVISKQEYSYARRAQSVLETLCWRDVATVDTDDLPLAISESMAAIKDWAERGYVAELWQLEGRGAAAGIVEDLTGRLL